MRSTVRLSSLLLLVLLGAVRIAAAAEPSRPANAVQASRWQEYDPGLIFNASLAPLEIQAYEAGLGMKVSLGLIDLRGLLDLVVSSPSAFSVKSGAAVEYHLTPEPLSFYVGGSASAGYLRQAGSFSSFVLSLGAIMGVEYFPLKFLSVFVEYALDADLTWTTDLSSSETAFYYLIDTRLGNDSEIGIVIHILRLLKK